MLDVIDIIVLVWGILFVIMAIPLPQPNPSKWPRVQNPTIKDT